MVRHWVFAALLAATGSLVLGGWVLGGDDTAVAKARAAKGAVRLAAPGGAPLQGKWQSWADAALVPTLRGRVTVRIARCPARPSAAGCVYTRRPRTIFVRPKLRDPRGVLLHELGHVFDLKVMNNRDRGRFRRIVGRKHGKWWRGKEPLAEVFGEAYSWCARYARIVSIARYSSYDYRPTGRQHRRICRLIRRAARDAKPPKPPTTPPAVTGPHPPPPPPPSAAPGVVPGDPERDPGPQEPEDPYQPPAAPGVPLPLPTATPTPGPGPAPPLPVPTLP